MTHNQINHQAGMSAMLFAGLSEQATAPVFIERPIIKTPRSATRVYTDSELQTVAAMLNKLRCRDDQKILANAPVVDDADHALDVAVNRLLRVL